MTSRTEIDSLGPVEVPSYAYWGAQTQRSIGNFPFGARERMPIEIVHALAMVKLAAARVNRRRPKAEGGLDPALADAIEAAALEVIDGALDDQFPLVIWQTGSGTQTNMNVNEVLSNRAIELAGGERGSKKPVHPNDHVNCSQSSNDVFPTAMHVATVLLAKKTLIPHLVAFHKALEEKVRAFSDIVKVGRTHLMDAAPLTLGQEFSGYAAQVHQGLRALEALLEPVYELALGGTAVGTGLNSHPEFAVRAARQIAALTGQPFVTAPNKFAALAGHDALVGFSGALRQLATVLLKFAHDIAWLGSGPRCGLGELHLPANEPGSSIMPGKVNPTQCESMMMVAVQVMGNDAAIGFAASLGNFELNVYKPVIIYNLLESMHLIADVAENFTTHCLKELQPNKKRIAALLEHSLMLATALNPVIGYDKAAQIVKKAYADDLSLKDAAHQLGYLQPDEFDRLVDARKMLGPQP